MVVDMQGYSIVGPSTAPASYGIQSYGSNVEIRNGTVRNFYFGIFAGSDSEANRKYGNRIISMRAIGNYYGIFTIGLGYTSHGAIIKDCIAADNIQDGIVASDGASVIRNTAYRNRYIGISAFFGCNVRDNVAYNNAWGIAVGESDLIDGNTAYGNTVRNMDTAGCTTCTFGVNHAP